MAEHGSHCMQVHVSAINLHPTDDEWVAMGMQNGEGTADT